MSNLENPYLLGPFYDVDEDRTEIIPLGYEESHEPLSLCMATYQVISNEPSLDGTELSITNCDVTEFIQADWNRVFGPVQPNRGFLLAYRAGAFAAGRVAEEIVLQKLFDRAKIFGSQVNKTLLFSEAQDLGTVVKRKGSQSDDLILILENGLHIIVESKAAFSGRGYLRRCVPKALSQLAATLARNPNLGGAALCLTDLRLHRIVIVTMTEPTESRIFVTELINS